MSLILTKFENFNSPEVNILKELFQTLPMMDNYIANIIESYIYSMVREYYTSEKCSNSLYREYRTKYGIKDGEFKQWFPTGQLAIQRWFLDGKMDGEYNEWSSNGNIFIQVEYVNGKMNGEYKKYNSNGELTQQSAFVNDKREGVTTYYYGKNRPDVIECYKDGKLNGERKSYHQNGWLLNTRNFVNGVENGEEIWYQRPGKIKSKCNIVNWKKEGEYLEWSFHDDYITLRCYYKNGELQGKYTKYLKDGSIYEECEFFNGTKVESNLTN